MKRQLGFGLLFVISVAAAGSNRASVPRGKPRPQVDQLWNCVETWESMLGLQTAIEAYGIDHPTYPMVKTMEELRAQIQPAYIANTPLTDAWGTPFRYVVSADGKEYSVVSAGSDRVFEETTWMTPAFLSDSARDSVRGSRGWERYREWVIQR